MESLTDADLAYIRSLRERGFAVCVWTPLELELLDEDMSIEELEDAMCEFGSNFMGNY